MEKFGTFIINKLLRLIELYTVEYPRFVWEFIREWNGMIIREWKEMIIREWKRMEWNVFK